MKFWVEALDGLASHPGGDGSTFSRFSHAIQTEISSASLLGAARLHYRLQL